MMTIGNVSLAMALLVATVAVLAALAAARFGSTRLLAAAKAGVFGIAVLLGGAAAALLVLLVNSDFHVDYVTRYTERALPLGYKLAAFWAGQEGSLLLWACLLAGMAVIAVLTLRGPYDQDHANHKLRQHAVTIATLALVSGFFVALMLCAANPFRPTERVLADGRGLNPMLQNIGMIAHPPILFLGYGGFTIPFAIMLGAMAAGRRDDAWIGEIRRWALVAWMFLSAGILLGAQWAYVELGWGGYWAWDPVENASLLPWLTGTALLHSIMAQQHRGTLKVWNVALIAATFILCIFGTYLTRSGVIQSVHAFEASSIGTFFLVFLGISLIVSVGIVLLRWKALRPTGTLGSPVGREAMILVGNFLLVGMAALTLIGTVFPLISGSVTGQAVSVSGSFYNKAVLPLALGLIAIMSIGPALGEGDAGKLLKRLAVPLILAAILAGALIGRGYRGGWIIGCAIVGVVGVTTFAIELVRAWAARARVKHENPLVALLHVVDGNHRRYGGQVVHMGVLMILAGIAGSSLLGVKETFQLNPGQTVAFAGGTLKLDKIHDVTAVNYNAVEAVVTLTDNKGVATTLRPQRRFFNKSQESSSEVDIRSDLRRDLYLILAGWEDGGNVTAIEAIVNPLVNWIWIGGITLVFGTMFCLLPRLMRGERRATAPATAAKEVAIPRRRAVGA
jgi:cytochrome c-type biogenesis protein CcmF